MAEDDTQVDGMAAEAAGVEAQARALEDRCRPTETGGETDTEHAPEAGGDETATLVATAERLQREVAELEAAAAFGLPEADALQSLAETLQAQAARLESLTRDDEAARYAEPVPEATPAPAKTGGSGKTKKKGGGKG